MLPMKVIINHIVNGSFTDSVCLICLCSLDKYSEDIFTKVCKEELEYCVADILNLVFNRKILETDNYRVCPDCFIGAFLLYKFYLQTKKSQNILDFYVNELSTHLDTLTDTTQSDGEIVCIRLPLYEPECTIVDLDLGLFANQINKRIHVTSENIFLSETNNRNDTTVTIKGEANKDEGENTIIVMNELNQIKFFKISDNGSIQDMNDQVANVPITNELNLDISNDNKKNTKNKIQKERKKRSPMAYISCTQCPVKYRFTSKLKEHMKIEHNIDLFICKVCKIVIDDETKYYKHLKTHTYLYICSVCGVAFKKSSSIISHLQRHEDMKKMEALEGSHVCEVCGLILPDKEALQDHCNKNHEKKYICFYCGRSYKGELSLEDHIKKHEFHNKKSSNVKSEKDYKLLPSCGLNKDKSIQSKDKEYKCKKCTKCFSTQALLKEHNGTHNDFYCEKCSRNFVDARSLMWHQRLHNNERPYICSVCSRSFVSENRRNQHATCAHTAPTLRCPLCPSLFHLRSIVNTHIRKVHLKDQNQRRYKCSKYQDVYWRTETVPIPDLSIAVQNDLLEMQTNTAHT